MRWGWVNFQCRGVLLILIIIGQGSTAFAEGAGGVCLDIFTHTGRRPDIDEILSQRAGKPKTTNQPTGTELSKFLKVFLPTPPQL